MKSKLAKLYKEFSGTIILRLLAAWSFSAVVAFVACGQSFTSPDDCSKMSTGIYIVLFVTAFAAFTVFAELINKKKADSVLLAVFFGIYSILVSLKCQSWYTVFVFGAAWVLLLYYCFSKGYFSTNINFSKKVTVLFIAFASAVFIFFVGAKAVLRYKTFSCPNYDFGIFCNMFYNMKKSFLPVTTCERDEILSHFAIHISPVFYLLLPFYALFPSGITIQLSQTLLLVSGVVPVYLIAKKYGIKNIVCFAISCVYALSPVLACGTNYDFHENCFLAPLLLWMFYFFEKEKYIPFAVFAALTLCVKEDAAIYVAFFALYMIFDRKKYLAGSITGVCAVLYFVFAIFMLTKYGNGVMTSRYSNYIAENGGFFEMLKNIITNPAYVFSQLFVSRDGTYSDKILFILQMTVPLGFIPFTAKKPSRLILLLPMVLINLMTVYVYQYQIGYQYSFGSFVFLVYLSVINLSELSEKPAHWLSFSAAIITVLCFCCSAVPNFCRYKDNYIYNSEIYAQMEEFLDEIPEEKSVICSTFLLPHLTERDEIYEIEYHDPKKNVFTDYVVLDMRQNSAQFVEQYSGYGYTVIDTLKTNGTDLIVLMSRTGK